MVDDVVVLIASANEGKIREVEAILADLPVRLSTLRDHPDLPEAHEIAPTFDGNAREKALHYARMTGSWALADDSGLEVDALGGQPGVLSARYAGADRDPAANNEKLIAELARTPSCERTARFRCAVALAHKETVLATGSGSLEGVIVGEPRGTNGFGYDPLFLVPELGMTTAEMTPEQKNRISHRRRALDDIRPKIALLLDGLS